MVRPKKRRLRRQAAPRGPAQVQWTGNGLMTYVRLYLDWSALNVTAATVTNRSRTLERFVSWCEVRGLSQPDELTRAVFEAYQRYLYLYRKDNGQALAIRSQRALLTPLMGWCGWMSRERYVPYNAAAEMVLPKKPFQLPKVVLSVAQVERLMAQPDVQAITGVRDRAMLEVLYSTGLRRMELAALTVSDVDTHTRTVRVRCGKGRRDRLVPVGERACYWVERYVQEERAALMVRADEWMLFLTDYGTAFELGQLSGIVSRYMRRAAIVDGSCHALRHACATHMLENGADVRYIQALLGHAELTSTQIYTQVAIGKLRQIHAATHPAKLTRDDELASLLAAIDAEAAEDALEES
ncbi:site-specific tyrosine recombinase XerC [Paraburkholderia sp. RL17-337-BIB-A]|uniref:site-specific tyrosine recombinase XerC n=1 Tax=Paraburkholderia sp. RL17-337-BIB-A TaxID=3031636 RepID=UPI0038BCF39D